MIIDVFTLWRHFLRFQVDEFVFDEKYYVF